MSWLTRVRNSLSFGSKRESPEDLWVKCPGCNEMLFANGIYALNDDGLRSSEIIPTVGVEGTF